MCRVAALEQVGNDFSVAKGRTCALLAAAGCAGHLNMTLSSTMEAHSTRLLALLDSVQSRLSEDDIVQLRAKLQSVCGHSHSNAAIYLNPPQSSLMAPIMDPDTVY